MAINVLLQLLTAPQILLSFESQRQVVDDIDGDEEFPESHVFVFIEPQRLSDFAHLQADFVVDVQSLLHLEGR